MDRNCKLYQKVLLDEETFLGIVIEQVRAGDTIPLKLFINRLRADARTALTSQSFDEFLTLADRIACLAALCINLDLREHFSQILNALNKIYDLGFVVENTDARTKLPVKPSTFWLEIIRRVYSIGGLAVRREAWTAVKALILQRPRGLVKGEYYNNWLRHALTMAARAGELEEQQEDHQVEAPLLGLCQQTALRLKCLSDDADPEEVLDSIVQFDVYFNMVALSVNPKAASSDFYPNFARFYSQRSDPAFRKLIESAAVRNVLTETEDERLASDLHKLFEMAASESFRYSGWSGTYDPVVTKFLTDHPSKQTRP